MAFPLPISDNDIVGGIRSDPRKRTIVIRSIVYEKDCHGTLHDDTFDVFFGMRS